MIIFIKKYFVQIILGILSLGILINDPQRLFNQWLAYTFIGYLFLSTIFSIIARRLTTNNMVIQIVHLVCFLISYGCLVILVGYAFSANGGGINFF
jgi:hypothetical protein